jgi:hypothetical protein
MFGLMAYPAQGIYKSIRGKGPLDPLLRAKCALVDDYVQNCSDCMDTKKVAAAFNSLVETHE